MVKDRVVLGATHAHVSLDPCKVGSVKGNWRGTVDAFLLIMDVPVTDTIVKGALPADSDNFVPLRSIQVFASAPFVFEFSPPLECEHSCVIAFSSNSEKLAIVAAGEGDIEVTGEGFTTTAITTEVGGIASGDAAVESKEVWTDANGPKRLLRVDVVSTSDSTAYLWIAGDEAGTYSRLLGTVLAAETKVFAFGDGKGVVFLNEGTEYNGCSLFMSSSATALTATEAGEFKIRASYKT